MNPWQPNKRTFGAPWWACQGGLLFHIAAVENGRFVAQVSPGAFGAWACQAGLFFHMAAVEHGRFVAQVSPRMQDKYVGPCIAQANVQLGGSERDANGFEVTACFTMLARAHWPWLPGACWVPCRRSRRARSLCNSCRTLAHGGKFEDSEVIGFKAKGFASECVTLLQKRFLRINAGARGLLICKQCAWTSASLGLRRATKRMRGGHSRRCRFAV